MKKKIRFVIAVLTISAIAAFNVYLSTNSYNLSDVSLANVEALATGEDYCPDCPVNIPHGLACATVVNGTGFQIILCTDCKPHLSEPKNLNHWCYTDL